MDNVSRRTSGRQPKTTAKMAELKQQTLEAAFKKQKKATLKKEKKRFAELYRGISKKRSKILNRLSGLKKGNSKQMNKSRRMMNERVSRIKTARNTMIRKHRMGTPPKNERNELANLMKTKLSIHDGGSTRRKCD